MRIRFSPGFLCSILLLLSCEQYTGGSADDFESDIIGTWGHTDNFPSGLSEADFRFFDMVFTYTFNSDATYSHNIDFYGFKDENPDEIIGQSETVGTFEVREDSIFISARKNTSWEKGFNPEATTTVYPENEGYGSRFEITDKTLTLYYISYPADAPLLTQMSYQRID